MHGKPRIAVILDENTSGDATQYEAAKTLFVAIRDAGGLPFGVPYLPEVVATVINDFDGVLCGGGRFAYPDDWYLGGRVSRAPLSERLTIEREIVEGCLKRDKPILGLCAGMQLLACVNGCRLWSDVSMASRDVLNHDDLGGLHPVKVIPDTKLHALVAQSSLLVNTTHQEAVGELSPSVVASARADDNVIEAIEVTGQTFAVGLQWHQERFAGSDHAGNQVFRGFVEACRTA
jgi:putative glutamine amidotransferase